VLKHFLFCCRMFYLIQLSELREKNRNPFGKTFVHVYKNIFIVQNNYSKHFWLDHFKFCSSANDGKWNSKNCASLTENKTMEDIHNIFQFNNIPPSGIFRLLSSLLHCSKRSLRRNLLDKCTSFSSSLGLRGPRLIKSSTFKF
jgi:hypothetical protein